MLHSGQHKSVNKARVNGLRHRAEDALFRLQAGRGSEEKKRKGAAAA
jgi:hypothetical protein